VTRARILVAILAALGLAVPLGAWGVETATFRFSATVAPGAVQPLSDHAYTISILNKTASDAAAQAATITVPSGFVVDPSTLAAATTTSGTCTAGAWTATLGVGSIDLGAPASASGELCPGGTLNVTFSATAPAAGSYTWTTQLSRGSTAFELQGSQPKVTVDGMVPPPPKLTKWPADPTNDTSPTFEFSDDAGTTFKCRLDGGGFSTCTSPKTYAGPLSDGPHTFDVKAVDAADNESAVTSYTWTVDTVPPPPPTIDSRPANPSGTSTARFVFSDSEGGVSFQCRLDGAAFTSCTSPKDYSALPSSSHTFEVRARDGADNVGEVAAYTWTVDTINPVVTVLSGPHDPTNETSATFSFSSSKSGSTFECRLDGGAFTSCSSPTVYKALPEGTHSFVVQATSPVGNPGPPSTYMWRIDLTPPVAPSIAASPSAASNQISATFVFSDESGATFECRLDGGGFSTCSSGIGYSSLADGTHTFAVRATDAAGNTGPAATYSWLIDTLAPETTIMANPDSVSSSASATFAFTSSEPLSTFACSLDGGAFASCSSPQSYGALARGSHTFEVRAADAAGNADPTPASYSWQVATLTPPDTTPPGKVRSLRRSVGYRYLKLAWSSPSDADFDHVRVLRSRSAKALPRTVVYQGRGLSYSDRRFQNGTYYRYAIVSYDHFGNASRGVTLTVPLSILLRSPRDGGVVKAPPLLIWAGIGRATYYNVQLYYAGQKVLSAWPAADRLAMKRSWLYQGRRVLLKKGAYRWYVWPGFGARSKGKYGQLLGTGTFVVR
jgi:large repetitive protein